VEQKRIAVIDLNTSTVSHLTDNHTAAVCPSWCPRRDRIAFAAAPSPSTAAAVEVANQPDGCLRNAVSGSPGYRRRARRYSSPRSLYRDEEPMWSADGRHILFARIDRGNNRRSG